MAEHCPSKSGVASSSLVPRSKNMIINREVIDFIIVDYQAYMRLSSEHWYVAAADGSWQFLLNPEELEEKYREQLSEEFYNDLQE